MESKQRSRRDFRQNIAITLLAVSAVLLFAQTQLYNLGREAAPLHSFSGAVSPEAALPSEQIPLATPVRIAVTGPYGRYGNVALTTSQPEFEPLGTLLREVLGSAQAFSPCLPEDFERALSSEASIYYDFCTVLPLSVLAELLGTHFDSDALPVRRIVIAQQDSAVHLYLWDNRSGYLQSSTAVSVHSLESIVGHYELGNASFALDETMEGAPALAPLSLLPDSSVSEALPVLSASSLPRSTDSLLSALSFNPRTNLRYPEADGTEVIVEGERTVSISPAGEVHYQSGGKPVLTVKAADSHSPSLCEAVTGVSQILNELTGSSRSLYLCSVQQNDADTVLRFDYQWNGIPILFSDGLPAAEVLLHGSTVADLQLRFRQYTDSGQPSMLLPLRQAVAVAAETPNAELILGYADRGTDTVRPAWLSE